MAKQITDRDILLAKERYKTMSRKEKISYIWEYYKLHIVAGIIAVFIVGSIINSTLINPPKKSGLCITFIDAPINREGLDEYLPKFNELFIEDNSKYEVTAYEYYLGSDDVQYTSAAIQKIMAQIQVAELDIIVAYKDTFYGYAAQGIFYDLDTIPQFASGTYNKEYMSTEYEEDKKAFGISLAGCELFYELGFIPDDYLIGIVINSAHEDLSVEFIEYVVSSTGDR